MSERSAIIVADASPIIFLEAIGQIDLLRSLGERTLVTQTVMSEVGLPLPPWLEIVPDPPAGTGPLFRVVLDAGERSAIALALEYPEAELLIDERAGRREATRLGLAIVGTLGILRRAKVGGLLPTVRPHVDRLLRVGFRISPRVLDDFLDSCGE